MGWQRTNAPIQWDVGQITRQRQLAEKIVIVDGQPGCGKTMLSPIVASLDRVELLTYAYELEYICRLSHMNKISLDAAITLAKMLPDLQIYKSMMGREINFRPSDLSSVFRHVRPWKYFTRIFREGDRAIIKRLETERPILHLTTHNLVAYSEPLFAGLENRLVMIELVRHPLYQIKQQAINMDILPEDPRDIDVYFDFQGRPIPYYTLGWEKKFVSSNPIERAIYWMENMTKITDVMRNHLKKKYLAQIITIPFEKFVLNPDPYLEKITSALGSRANLWTKRMLKKQKVPRKMIADGLNLKIYKRYGWEQSKTKNEEDELKIRRDYAVKHTKKETLSVLDILCEEYEEKYLF